MLPWKRVGYAITEKNFSTGFIHMFKTRCVRGPLCYTLRELEEHR